MSFNVGQSRSKAVESVEWVSNVIEWSSKGRKAVASGQIGVGMCEECMAMCDVCFQALSAKWTYQWHVIQQYAYSEKISANL